MGTAAESWRAENARTAPGLLAGSEDAEKIPNNIRMLRILETLAAAGTALSATEINAAIGLPKPTIHRLCQTLEREGFLARPPGSQRYEAAPRLRRLAAGIMGADRLRVARHAVLAALSRAIGETCNIAIPSDEGMLYVDRVETQWPLRVQLPTGSTVPFHCTASGKLYLSSLEARQRETLLESLPLTAATARSITDPGALAAEIETIRVRGYSLDDEEFVEGMVAVAVPVTGSQGRLLATLSFHAPTQRMPLAQAIAHLDALKQSAAALAEVFGEEPERG